MKSSIVALGDVHAPFHNKKALQEAYQLIKRYQPEVVVQMGDLYDFVSFSKFPKNPNFITPDDEIEQGREAAEEMWDCVKIACPKARKIQLKGNHDIRPIRYVKEFANASITVMKKFVKDMMTFPGVELVEDEYEIDGIVFMHGFKKLGEHAKWNQQSTCVAHSHRPGVIYDSNRNGPFFEFNVGWLGDPKSEAFSYGAWKKLHKMVNGIGYIDKFGPVFNIIEA